MCGLVAIIDHSSQKFYQEDVETFWTMLLLNSLRGQHSTGVAGIRKDGRGEYIKVPGNPFNLDKWKDFDEWKKRMVSNYTAVLGHGRFATKGEISCKNAHPFKRGDITLIHNGTLTNFETLKSLYKNGDIFEVDSDICCQLFNNYSVEEVIKKLYGAFAFIWHDQRDNKIRVIRNMDRPLWMFKRTDKDKYYLSSDRYLFDWIKAKYNMQGAVEEIQVDTLYTFDNVVNGQVSTEKVATNFSYVQNHYGGYSGGSWSGDGIEDFFGGRYQDRQRQKYKEPVTLPKSVEKYQKGEIDLVINQVIKFNPIDYKPHMKNKMQDEKSNTIVGDMINVDGPVEVVGTYEGNIENIFDAEVLSGVIRTIVVLPESNKYLCRLIVHSITPIATSETSKEDSKVITLPTSHVKRVTTVSEYLPDDVMLTLFDKSRINAKNYIELVKDGCSFCGSLITTVQSPFVLITPDKAYCPDCTVKGKHLAS